MTVEGELDDISGSGQTRAAQDLCTGVPASERQHLEVPGAGHYGIFSGRRWRDIVYPQVVKFIQGHALKAKASAPKAVAAAPVAAKAAKAVVKAPAKAPVKAPVKPAAANVAKPVAKAAVKAVAVPAAKPAAKAAAPVKALAKTSAKAVAKAPAKNGKAAAQPKGTVKTTWVAPKA
jgi:poly(3-hydroxybutyrate) depolymerase